MNIFCALGTFVVTVIAVLWCAWGEEEETSEVQPVGLHQWKK